MPGAAPVNHDPSDMQSRVRRETIVSILINTVLSLVFFLLIFDAGKPVPVADLGSDFLPQSFMIALMASLVPGALIARRAGRPAILRVAKRAFTIALAATVAIGGAAWLACWPLSPLTVEYGLAVAIKLAFGAALAALVTPSAVRFGYVAAADRPR